MPQTNLGTMFKLFSLAFEPPSADLAESVASGALRDGMRAAWEALELSQAEIEAFYSSLEAYVGRPVDEVMHELRRESTRLFLDSRPLVTNSEGLWRKKAEGKTNAVLVINSYSIAVANFMRRCGVVKTQDYNDCVDYIEVECDFAGFLADSPEHLVALDMDPLELLEAFMEEHMKLWVPGFCSDVVNNSCTIYYSALGRLMGEYIKEF